MPLGKKRNAVVYGINAARGAMHRYTKLRWAIGLTFTAAIALLAVTGTLRFDFWRGEHVYLGQRVGLVEAAKAFAFPFLAVNIVIILASRFIGRYLCGFVCPVGALARLGEWFRWRNRKGKSRWLRLTSLGLTSFGLAAITFSFWVDWRVFAQGSTFAISVAAGFLGTMALGLFYLVDGLGLRFCRDVCPSGVYFALMGPTTNNGVEFSNPDSCTDCKACETACPMDLEPRHLDAPPSRGGLGLYPDNLSNHALCIRCGDCISACEETTKRDAAPTPLRIGWLRDSKATNDVAP